MELTSPAEALVESRGFIGTDSVSLIFGDNLFFGRGVVWLDTDAHQTAIKALKATISSKKIGL